MTAKQVQEFKETEIGKIPTDWEIKTLGEISNVTKLAGYEFTKFIKFAKINEISTKLTKFPQNSQKFT